MTMPLPGTRRSVQLAVLEQVRLAAEHPDPGLRAVGSHGLGAGQFPGDASLTQTPFPSLFAPVSLSSLSSLPSELPPLFLPSPLPCLCLCSSLERFSGQLRSITSLKPSSTSQPDIQALHPLPSHLTPMGSSYCNLGQAASHQVCFYFHTSTHCSPMPST